MLDLAMHGAGRKAKWNLANNASEAERAMVQHRRCFDLLLTHGAWVNGDPIRITPLQHAIDVAYIPFVEALLERAADPHVEDDGETVLDRVRQRGGKSSEYGKARDRQILALLEAVRPA
jgi:ankyrin repeat protein